MYILQCKAIYLYVRSCKSLGQYVLLYVLVMYNSVRLCITIDDHYVGLRMVCYMILAYQMRRISASNSSFFSLVLVFFFLFALFSFIQVWIIGHKCYMVSFIVIFFIDVILLLFLYRLLL